MNEQNFTSYKPGIATYDDPVQEYNAAQTDAVLIDRSMEGRLLLTGKDRLTIPHKISTNAVDKLGQNEGAATVLTTAIGRIIDRITLHNTDEQHTLLRTSPGRAEQIAAYLRRNIFFRDELQVTDVSQSKSQLLLAGVQATKFLKHIAPDFAELDLNACENVFFNGLPLSVIRVDQVGVPAYALVVDAEHAASIWDALLQTGWDDGLRPAGQAIYHQLRIEAGLPGLAELNEDYIPLEAGLWGDVSFNKGCYTGQEIIARMESRGQLAKKLVRVILPQATEQGTAWFYDGRRIGELTSIAHAGERGWVGLGFVKTAAAEENTLLTLEDGVTAVIEWVSA